MGERWVKESKKGTENNTEKKKRTVKTRPGDNEKAKMKL